MVDSIKTNSVVKFVSENFASLGFLAIATVGIISILSNVSQHREDVQSVSVQNAGCIYLESSKLGEGQHYMICNGQITLKRLQDVEPIDAEQALEEAIPEVTNSAKPEATASPTK